ncbi:MAG: sensor domain-containing diguanylate cyclase [Candidatus Brocadiia bacterium]
MQLDSNDYKVLLDNLYDGVYFVDRERQIIYWNKGAERITGYTSAEVVGRRCSDNILMHIDDEGHNLCTGQCPLFHSMSECRGHEAEVFLHHKDGYRVPVSVRVSPLRDKSGNVIGAIEIFSDNTRRQDLISEVSELRRLALLDPVTELGNRHYAEIHLNTKLNEMSRYELAFGILFVDIDYFKSVNDTYGHDVGDRILKMTAKTMLNVLRPSDLVGRWGGDEFVIIVPNVDQEHLYSIAHKLRAFVEQSSFSIGNNTVKVTVSIGATIARTGDTMESLVKRADKLVYRSKSDGRNRVTTCAVAEVS